MQRFLSKRAAAKSEEELNVTSAFWGNWWRHNAVGLHNRVDWYTNMTPHGHKTPRLSMNEIKFSWGCYVLLKVVVLYLGEVLSWIPQSSVNKAVVRQWPQSSCRQIVFQFKDNWHMLFAYNPQQQHSRTTCVTLLKLKVSAESDNNSGKPQV